MDGKQLCRTDVDLRMGYMKVNKSIEEGQLAAKAREEALRKKEAMEENARMKREKRLDKIFEAFLVLLAFVLGLIADEVLH